MPFLFPSGSKLSPTWKISEITTDRLEVTTEGSVEGCPLMFQLSTLFCTRVGVHPPAAEAACGHETGFGQRTVSRCDSVPSEQKHAEQYTGSACLSLPLSQHPAPRAALPALVAE